MKSILFIFLAALSLNGYADSKFVCSNGAEERIIEVVYSSSKSDVPCAVEYSKSGTTKVLWSAQNESGYCESKAKDFSLKLSDMGWFCSSANN